MVTGHYLQRRGVRPRIDYTSDAWHGYRGEELTELWAGVRRSRRLAWVAYALTACFLGVLLVPGLPGALPGPINVMLYLVADGLIVGCAVVLARWWLRSRRLHLVVRGTLSRRGSARIGLLRATASVAATPGWLALSLVGTLTAGDLSSTSTLPVAATSVLAVIPLLALTSGLAMAAALPVTLGF